MAGYLPPCRRHLLTCCRTTNVTDLECGLSPVDVDVSALPSAHAVGGFGAWATQSPDADQPRSTPGSRVVAGGPWIRVVGCDVRRQNAILLLACCQTAARTWTKAWYISSHHMWYLCRMGAFVNLLSSAAASQ